MKNRFAIASTQVCTPTGSRPAVVVVSGEKIESIVSMEDFAGDVACDHVGDLMISPGVIDTHVHINEPGRTDWEGFETATAAAAAGGTTTIIDMPLNSTPVTTTVAALREKQNAARRKCRVDVGFYGGLVADNLESIPALLTAGVFGIKSFLCDSGLDEFPATSETDLRAVLPILRDAQVPLLVHAELVDESEAATITNERSYLQYLASRPKEWELTAIEMLARLCREFQAPIHVVHVATQEAAKLIRKCKTENLPISFETCPHYLFFNAEQVADGDTRFKCAPPIRSAIGNHVETLWSLLSGNMIDTIGSDHSPCPPEMKSLDTGRFKKAWGGIAGLQFSLSVMSTLAHRNKLPPERLADWMSKNPARLAGLHHSKGELAAGMDADIVVWDPNAEFTVEAANIFHRHKITPYDGEILRGKVQRTYVRGNLVFQNGNQMGAPIGKLLERPK